MTSTEGRIAELLFGDEGRTDLYEIFQRGYHAGHGNAIGVLDALTHPELADAHRVLHSDMSRFNTNAIYVGDKDGYESGVISLPERILFLPNLHDDIYAPFVGLQERANHSYRFQRGSQDYELVFNNVRDRENAVGSNGRHKSRHQVRSRARSR